MFSYKSQLNNSEFHQLSKLVDACKAHDGHTLPVYAHILQQYRQKPGIILHYENSTLLGFASAYHFYDQAIEIALMVHPDRRRTKIATQLLGSLLPFILSDDIKQFIFSTTPRSETDWLPSFGFSYHESEYEMARTALAKESILKPRLHIKKATVTELTQLCAIDKACFPKQSAAMEKRLIALLENRDYRIIMATLDNKPVAKAHIHWEEHRARLSDIAVLPAHQGQGLGREIIANCINYALDLKKPNICLDVQTNNDHAIRLYKGLGFETTNICEYWTIPCIVLASQLLNNNQVRIE